MNIQAEIDRCDREIAACERYQGPDVLGATLGSIDWRVEKELLRKPRFMFAIDRDDNITAIPAGTEIVADDDVQYFGSRRELTDLILASPGERAVSIWNSIPGVNPIKTKKFRNRGTAIERIWGKLVKLWPDSIEAKKKKPSPARASKPRASGDGKGAAVLAMISRAEGAAISEIMNSTGWQAHSVRGFLSTSAKKRGIKIESNKSESGERVYRITA